MALREDQVDLGAVALEPADRVSERLGRLDLLEADEAPELDGAVGLIRGHLDRDVLQHAARMSDASVQKSVCWRSRPARRFQALTISPELRSARPTMARAPAAIPVIGSVFESPAAFGDATAEASDCEEPLELEPALGPLSLPPPPELELTTRMVPCMFGWMVQMYEKVPGCVNRCEVLCPLLMFGVLKLPSLAVALWGASSWFVQVTVSPTLTVTDAGENAKLTMLTLPD